MSVEFILKQLQHFNNGLIRIYAQINSDFVREYLFCNLNLQFH